MRTLYFTYMYIRQALFNLLAFDSSDRVKLHAEKKTHTSYFYSRTYTWTLFVSCMMPSKHQWFDIRLFINELFSLVCFTAEIQTNMAKWFMISCEVQLMTIIYHKLFTCQRLHHVRFILAQQHIKHGKCHLGGGGVGHIFSFNMDANINTCYLYIKMWCDLHIVQVNFIFILISSSLLVKMLGAKR